MMKKSLFVATLLATLAGARAADAFCGFYVGGAGAKMFNDATVVVMMRAGTRTVLSMQNAYKGPPEKFAMVVPVPVVLQEENVKTLEPRVLEHIDQLASPRLVEYWEQDPCSPTTKMPSFNLGASRMTKSAAMMDAAPVAQDLGVRIEAKFAVGEYEIVILSAQDSGGLDTWLHREGYNIPAGGEPYFRPYVQSGSKFFVAKVDVSKLKVGRDGAVLSPLRFHYDSDEFRLPVRLGLINSSGTQDLIVHIIGRGKRYEVANYPNVTIPTNIDIAEEHGNFGSFYAALFDRALEKNPKSVVTEYAWEPTSCDPCPGPALDYNDLATLGNDVLPKSTSSGTQQLVLTRLHARYTKESLGDDLVFREAKPITGGREVHDEKTGKLENGAAPASFNNFQARYAVRHTWTGPIECKNPVRGVWGERPGSSSEDVSGRKSAHAASNLGFVSRTVKPSELGPLVKQDIPELDVKSGRRKGGCLGCAVTSSTYDDSSSALVALGLACVGVMRRRYRSMLSCVIRGRQEQS